MLNENDSLYTLPFVNDRVMTVGDDENCSYMMRKSKAEYMKWGPDSNTKC